MSTYAIGDIQGCFDPLLRLLEHIDFNADNDTLWFTGDLVNRGPKSLETLRFIKQLGNKHKIVLGNHDLHMLAVAYGKHEGWAEDTLTDILSAPDRIDLFEWLRHQEIMHHEGEYTIAHAGLAPMWDLAKASLLAREVENVLRSDQAEQYFHHMYGNHPKKWDDNLEGYDRLRCITNYFTRMRFCYADGSLDLKNKGTLDSHSVDTMPWFQVPERKSADLNILFGHWAALAGVTHTPRVFALDTGCVWGYCLTAMRLEDQKRFQVLCSP
jgi:bis(5'-nucleosyl)-tetraphosphatase (symmetrical)